MLQLLQYPFILLLILVIVGFLLHHLLLPRFQMFYDSMGYEPNMALKWFLHFIQTFPYYFTFSLMTIGCLFIVLLRILHRKSALDRAQFFQKPRLFTPTISCTERSSLPENGAFY